MSIKICINLSHDRYINFGLLIKSMSEIKFKRLKSHNALSISIGTIFMPTLLPLSLELLQTLQQRSVLEVEVLSSSLVSS